MVLGYHLFFKGGVPTKDSCPAVSRCLSPDATHLSQLIDSGTTNNIRLITMFSSHCHPSRGRDGGKGHLQPPYCPVEKLALSFIVSLQCTFCLRFASFFICTLRVDCIGIRPAFYSLGFLHPTLGRGEARIHLLLPAPFLAVGLHKSVCNYDFIGPFFLRSQSPFYLPEDGPHRIRIFRAVKQAGGCNPVQSVSMGGSEGWTKSPWYTEPFTPLHCTPPQFVSLVSVFVAMHRPQGGFLVKKGPAGV